MRLDSYGLSDVGTTRKNNEDFLGMVPEMGFYILADGMGGHPAGEVAAEKAVEYVSSAVKNLSKNDYIEWPFRLKEAIENASSWVYRLGREKEEWRGMGTTLACLLWTETAVIYGHVGDSRIYRLRGGKLELLTRDHALKDRFPYRNLITKAIGTKSKVHPEIAFAGHRTGDLFILCSDGLSDVMGLADIEKILNKEPNLEQCAKILIEEAKNKGSSDNITLLLVKDVSGQSGNDALRPASTQGHAGSPFGTSSQPL